MTTHTISDDELKKTSFNRIAYLVFGSKATDDIEKFRNLFNLEVKAVNIFPWGTETKYLNKKTPGICRLDSTDNKLVIEMYGYQNAPSNMHQFIKHEGPHEYCHVFADLLPKACQRYTEGVIIDGILYKNHMGMIKITNPHTGNPVGNGLLGKMFNETMMDIATAIANNSFDPNDSSITADDILRKPYKEWNSSTTGYSIFTTLTRLAIAAFNNSAIINYSDIISNQKTGFPRATVKMRPVKGTNEELIYKANDLLYGIFFDQLHIALIYDNIMGPGQYKKLCEHIDSVFIECTRRGTMPNSRDVKQFMDTLQAFLNKKITAYLNYGIIDTDWANRIVTNFNLIWQSMQAEYSSFFTAEELAGIRRAART